MQLNNIINRAHKLISSMNLPFSYSIQYLDNKLNRLLLI